LHNEELHKLYFSRNIIKQIKSRRMSWAEHVVRLEGDSDVNKVLMGELEENRPLRRPRRRWEHGIRMDLREFVWGNVDWIQLAKDRDRWRALLNKVKNLRILAPRI
jgi:hypothetical protein